MADINDNNMPERKGSTPNPDPTTLTTEALRREVAALKELIGSNMLSAQMLNDTKLHGINTQIQDLKDIRDSKIVSLKEELARAEALFAEKLDSVKDDLVRTEVLRNEKFASVEMRFGLNQQAIDAALSAAKEAVQQQNIANDRSITKSETATADQIRQMNLTTTTAIAGINLIIDDVKERINRIEGLRVGGKENSANMLAVIGVLITLGFLGLGLATFFANR